MKRAIWNVEAFGLALFVGWDYNRITSLTAVGKD